MDISNYAKEKRNLLVHPNQAEGFSVVIRSLVESKCEQLAPRETVFFRVLDVGGRYSKSLLSVSSCSISIRVCKAFSEALSVVTNPPSCGHSHRSLCRLTLPEHLAAISQSDEKRVNIFS